MEAQLKLIDLDDIDINEQNPRKVMDEESLEQLAASVASVGVIQPVVITTRDGRNLLVTGERRVKAARMAGLEDIPAVVRDLTDKEILEAMLVENLQREDLAPLEEADALNRLVKQHGWKQKDLAAHIGRSQPWVSKRIRLLALPEEAREALYSGRISIDDAMELCRLRKWPEKIIEALEHPQWSMKNQVEAAINRAKRDMAHDKAFAELEAEGKRVWRGRHLSLFYIGTESKALQLEPEEVEEHQKEGRECLAYGLSYDLEPVPVCNDRAHWYDEMHAEEMGTRERKEQAQKARVQMQLESDYEVIRSLTGSMPEVEAYIRDRALEYAKAKRVQMGAARAFEWKIGRRFDRERLSKEIKKARGRQLRRWWMITEALHDISYGWSTCKVLEVVRALRAPEDG